MQDVAIRFAQRVREHPIAHEAAVDEQVLRIARGGGVGGAHGPAGERQLESAFIDLRRLRRELVAEQRVDPRPPPLREQAEAHAAVVLEA